MTTKNASTIVSVVPENGKKYFTLAEANRALPYVSKIVADVTDRYTQVVATRHQIEQCQGDV